MALDAVKQNGPATRSFAADAHGCIMVVIRTGSTAYKVVTRKLASKGELLLDYLMSYSPN